MVRQAAAASAWAFWRTTASLVVSLVLDVARNSSSLKPSASLMRRSTPSARLRAAISSASNCSTSRALDEALGEFRVQVEDALDRMLVDHQHGHVGHRTGR